LTICVYSSEYVTSPLESRVKHDWIRTISLSITSNRFVKRFG